MAKKLPAEKDKLKRLVAAAQQRASADNRDSDVHDLSQALGIITDLISQMDGYRTRIEVLMKQRDAAEAAHDTLFDAVKDLDDVHPLVDEMLHTIREEAWEDMRRDGMLTPADMVEQFQNLFGDAISRDDAVVLTQWITGLRDDIREDAKRLLAHSIRRFLEGVD